MVCMQMRVFFQKPIQISFSEIHSRHRNLFWRADPHFDVGDQLYLVPKWSGEWWNSVTLLMQECNLKVSEWVFRKFIRGTGTFSGVRTPTSMSEIFRKFIRGTGTFSGVRTPTSMSEMHFYLLFSAFSTGYLPRRT
ncbi:hypothetical protein MGG_16497 [Pyricularia oryzae 70-15]|uniref:Uncharacterized protein n=1 Tax=Pyricularia oryzae (strain 70-15 / ATCC MYA-4617 / FGSC 8958) TaxID=242507 RepID=G4MQV1_PYRO7|nr:uncharacterized protein MGG_16497 [Pyricularia oryzae 70-15]EHA58182.1 hypothetical protein MGG_16497 [Pyricularia oryzae 70-15]